MPGADASTTRCAAANSSGMTLSARSPLLAAARRTKAAVVRQAEADMRMRRGHALELRDAVAELGGFRLQELAPRGRAEEQVARPRSRVPTAPAAGSMRPSDASTKALSAAGVREAIEPRPPRRSRRALRRETRARPPTRGRRARRSCSSHGARRRAAVRRARCRRRRRRRDAAAARRRRGARRSAWRRHRARSRPVP